MNVDAPLLPPDRIRDAIAFEVTGIDMAGPVFLKDNQKAWICLFTCAIYRAVHLDLVTSLSTSGFLQVFRRFVARRGRPRVVYTDNGTNFRGAENIFANIDWNEVTRYGTEQRICWRFNPPSAPWWGGWWERLIGILKVLLRKVLGRARLSGEEFYTTLCDCESVINSRPLTYVSNDASELIPLTPVMFLRELAGSGVPDCDFADSVALNRRVKYVQRLREDLRKRFRTEYLGQLRQKFLNISSRDINVGEIVLIGNDHSKRLEWPLGKVVEVMRGHDGKIRLVRLKTQHGLLLRPIQRLYPMEATSEAFDIQKTEQETNTSSCESEVEVSQGDEGSSTTVPKAEDYITRFGRKICVPVRFRE